jgi:DNA polymerase-3 subunit alpha
LASNGASAGPSQEPLPALPPDAEWTERELLANEKETLGFYISGHPLEQYHQEIKRYATKTLAQVQETSEGERVTVVGVAAAVVDRMTKTGKRMAIVTLEDMTGSLKMVCFSGGRGGQAGYEQWESDLKADDPLVITGAVTINNREESNPVREIKAEEITRLSELRRRKTRKVAFKVTADKVTAERLTSLKLVLVKHAGETPVSLEVTMPGEAEAIIRLAELRVQPTDALIHDVNRLFGGPVAELR